MTFIMALVFATWQVLLNNFVIEKAAFTGREIGILQSLREIPGFLAFTAIYWRCICYVLTDLSVLHTTQTGYRK